MNYEMNRDPEKGKKSKAACTRKHADFKNNNTGESMKQMVLMLC